MPIPFRVIVAGTRTFDDYELLCSTLDHLLADKMPDVVIVSGRQRGADRLGEAYARDRGLEVAPFPAEWAKHGKAAGPMRNQRMAESASALVLFWDGESRGSADMLERAKARRLAIRVIRYSESKATNPHES